jgi:acyl carrier protein
MTSKQPPRCNCPPIWAAPQSVQTLSGIKSPKTLDLSDFFAKQIMTDRLKEQVATIWARALGVKKVNPDDNFFALGGHSLLGVKMIAEIQTKTGLEEELKLADLLEFPTLGAFIEHLEALTAPSEESGSL